MSFLSKTVSADDPEFMVHPFEGGEYAPDEPYAGFVDRTPLEAGAHLLVQFYSAHPDVVLICEPHWLHGHGRNDSLHTKKLPGCIYLSVLV